LSEIENLIVTLPKAELHLHIEGSLEPELMLELAKKNGTKLPYASIDDIKNAYHFENLQQFLDLYYAGMSVLNTEQDFYDLTMAYLIKCDQQNIRHVEIFFDPQAHTQRGIAFDTVLNGIHRALSVARLKFNISFKLIMSFLRHLSEESAFKTLNQAQAHLSLIDGVGLDSSELGHPPAKFEQVFKAAKALGLKLVAHAGEEGPADYVVQALDLLKVDRIDHGNRSMESQTLLERLINEQMALTICPLSNLKLAVVDNLIQHPLKDMLELGVLVTVNSDDPSYFGGYLNENYIAVQNALELSREQVVQLVKNSVTASFLSDIEKRSFINKIDECIFRLN